MDLAVKGLRINKVEFFTRAYVQEYNNFYKHDSSDSYNQGKY